MHPKWSCPTMQVLAGTTISNPQIKSTERTNREGLQVHEQGILEQNQNLFTLRARIASGTIGFLAIGVCFTVVSSILIQALVSGHPAMQPASCEPFSSLILTTIGYAGFLTSWKELTITVDDLNKRFTTTTRNLITRTSKKNEATFTEIQAMIGTVDEMHNSVKVTIARDNQEAIRFQLDCNSYGPLEKYLKTLLPKVPTITHETRIYQAGMPTGHVNAVC